MKPKEVVLVLLSSCSLLVWCSAAAANSDLALVYPVGSGEDIILHHGDEYSDGGGEKTHQGIDIEATVGSVIIAPAAGVVSYVGMTPGHEGGVVDCITILAEGYRMTFRPVSAAVKEGEPVVVGDTIGVLLESGDPSALEPHLSFTLREADRDRYLDPEAFFTISSPTLPGELDGDLGQETELKERPDAPVTSAPGASAHQSRGEEARPKPSPLPEGSQNISLAPTEPMPQREVVKARAGWERPSNGVAGMAGRASSKTQSITSAAPAVKVEGEATQVGSISQHLEREQPTHRAPANRSGVWAGEFGDTYSGRAKISRGVVAGGEQASAERSVVSRRIVTAWMVTGVALAFGVAVALFSDRWLEKLKLMLWKQVQRGIFCYGREPLL